MLESKELQVMTAFGKSVDSALVLAAQPDEVSSAPWNHRTFVLQIRGGSAQIIETLPQPIHKSWRSDNGTAYCPSNVGHVLTCFDGAWNREKVCEREEYFGNIWGFSGETALNDTVFLCSNESFFIRNDGSWTEYPMPETVEMVSGVHGLFPHEVYVCTDEGLLCWNGKEFTELEGPDDEPIGVLVLSETQLLVTGEDLYLWSEEAGWMVLESPASSHTIAMLSFDGDIFIGTSEGVLRRHSDKLEMVTDSYCNKFMNVGDGIIASGDATYLFDGRRWTQIRLPKLAPGEVPK